MQASKQESVIVIPEVEPSKVMSESPKRRLARRPGSAKGILLNIADDFEAIPDGFEKYTTEAER